MTWTPLANESTHLWFDNTPSPQNPQRDATNALRPIALRLLDRAASILR